MKTPRKVLRRQFLASSTAGLAALGAAPQVLADLNAPEPVTSGVIGCGGRGMGHVEDLAQRARDPQQRVALAGVCDVYRPRLEQAAKLSGAKGYSDYRRLLDQKDITLGSNPGRSFTIRMVTPNATQFTRVYVVGNRMYQTAAMQEGAGDPAAAATFLDSFALTKP
jgi:hypothetical protein